MRMSKWNALANTDTLTLHDFSDTLLADVEWRRDVRSVRSAAIVVTYP